MILTDPYEIARYIKEVEKKTPVKCYVQLINNNEVLIEGINIYGNGNSLIMVGEAALILEYLSDNSENILYYDIESDRRNSAIPLLDTISINARIEPGAFIRDHVTIEDNCVIMMGAVINIGVTIGSGSMIDMGAVLGARVSVGKNAHVGAGAVLAGVLEPPSATPVIIGDDVLIGANAVILEGVEIGRGAVVAAGAVVTSNVEEYTVVAGSPAILIKKVDEKTLGKTEILEDLRQI